VISDVPVNLAGRQFIKKRGRTYLVLTLAELMALRDEKPQMLTKIDDDWCVEVYEKKLDGAPVKAEFRQT
jgi:hypothetical protein